MAAGRRADRLCNERGHRLGTLKANLLLEETRRQQFAVDAIVAEIISVVIYRGYVEDAVHEGSEQRLSDGPVAGHAHGAKC